MEKVQAFQASDGSLFLDSSQASEHEVSLIWQARIHEYINSGMCPYARGAQSGMVRKIVIGWERFKTESAHK